MKPKHTPGPWTVDVLDSVTNIESRFQTVATDVSNNDADLIAAAPDMLAALKQLLDAMDSPNDSDMAAALIRAQEVVSRAGHR